MPRAGSVAASGDRAPTARRASTQAAKGTASHPSRQLASPTSPIIGKPTIHAPGWPIRAQDKTPAWRSSLVQAAAAASPPERTAASPAPTAT